jgi:hypothetical protein
VFIDWLFPLRMKGSAVRKHTAIAALLIPALMFAFPVAASAQDSLAGNWKVTFLDGNFLLTFWSLKLDAKGGKLSGTLDAAPKAPAATIKSLTFQDGTLNLGLDLEGQSLSFAFKAPKGESKRLFGTISFMGTVLPAQLQAIKEASAKDLDPEVDVKIPMGGFKEIKENIVKRPADLEIFTVARNMLMVGIKDKTPVADLEAALTPVLQAAQQYGEWQPEMVLQFARPLVSNAEYAALGEKYARQALNAFGAKATVALQLRCLDMVSQGLQKQNKAAELAKVQGQIDGLEVKGHEENEKAGLGFDIARFGGRKDKKGNRVVLVELFTGAHCPPCVAADLAFEGLAKTYSTSDLVLLQYHLHIPAPDPMTTPDSEARAKYYGDNVRGTPSIFFNGKPAAGGGGYRPHAPAKYEEYRKVIDSLLDSDNKITLNASATRTGDSLSITTTAAGYKPSDKLKLRLALIEPWVRFAGSNGLSYHAHVVRALPGGPEGTALTKDNAKQMETVNLAELRKTVGKSLDPIESLDGQRPFSYRNLRLVAFVQNDETKEVLHAIEVPVKQ